MAVLDLALMGLLVAGLLFAIVELGLAAYAVNIFHRTLVPTLTRTGVDYGTVSVPGEYGFLLFCSIWTIIVCGLFLTVPMLFAKRMSARTLGMVTLAITTLTMIFWLAGFAALSALYFGYSPPGVPGALLAFAVMSWLVFLALVVINFLTAFGVLRSERVGHSNLFRKRGPIDSTPMTTTMDHTVDRTKHEVV